MAQPKITQWVFQIQYKKRGDSVWCPGVTKMPSSEESLFWPIRERLKKGNMFTLGFGRERTGRECLTKMRELRPDYTFRLIKRMESFQVIDE